MNSALNVPDVARLLGALLFPLPLQLIPFGVQFTVPADTLLAGPLLAGLGFWKADRQ